MPGKIQPPQIIARRRLGRCYELAGRGILKCGTEKDSGWRLVHGRARVSLSTPSLVGGHAWCENIRTGRVYDAVANRFYRREHYYRAWKAKPMRRFTPRQIAAKVLKVKHWGPF